MQEANLGFSHVFPSAFSQSCPQGLLQHLHGWECLGDSELTHSPGVGDPVLLTPTTGWHWGLISSACVGFARETVCSKMNRFPQHLSEMSRSQPPSVISRARRPCETPDSAGVYPYSTCNLQKTAGDGQNQHIQLRAKSAGSRAHSERDPEPCQPRQGSHKPAATGDVPEHQPKES